MGSKGLARSLRRQQTDAEAAVWRMLRSRQLGNAKFRRQQPIGPFVVDFLCLQHQLDVEIDGGQHDEKVDAERTAFLHRAGYEVIRFWDNEVLTSPGAVADAIAMKLGLA